MVDLSSFRSGLSALTATMGADDSTTPGAVMACVPTCSDNVTFADFEGVNEVKGSIFLATDFQPGSATTPNLTFVGQSGNDTLDLSAETAPGAGLVVSMNGDSEVSPGSLTGTSSADTSRDDAFYNVNVVTGSPVGTSFQPGTAAGVGFEGQGSSNTLDLSAAPSGTTVSVPTGSVSLTGGSDTFTDVQDFMGSSSGNTTFVASGAGGYTFTGQDTGNTLDLSAAPSGTTVTPNGDSPASPGTVQNLSAGVGGSTTDTFANIQSFTMPAPASADATLSDLTTSPGTLSPTFASGTTSYTESVASGVTSITVTPTTNSADSTVTVDGVPVSSGTASGSIPVSVGVTDVTVVVTAQDGVTTDTYTIAVAEAPMVTSISVASGPMSGGTTVVITGTGFSDATQVLFDSTTPASSFIVNSPTQITAVSPAHTGPGNVTVARRANIYVRSPGGTSPAGPADLFTYDPPPAVTSLSVDAGRLAGGTQVTIMGTGFSGATAVLFGSTPASRFSVESATRILAVSPAGDAGPVDLYVHTPGGITTGVPADIFTSYTA